MAPTADVETLRGRFGKPPPGGWRHRRGGGRIQSGELLRVPGYAEVSAVCTHPEHTGRSYAGALVATLVGFIRGRGEVPLLHVRPENRRAVELYVRLGFRARQPLRYAVLRKVR